MLHLGAPAAHHVLQHGRAPAASARRVRRNRGLDLGQALARRRIHEALGSDAPDGLDLEAGRAPHRDRLGPEEHGQPPRRGVEPDFRGAEAGEPRHRVHHAVERELGPALAPEIGGDLRGRDGREHLGETLGARGDRAVVLADLEGGLAGVGADGVAGLVHARADQDHAPERPLAPRHRGHAVVIDPVLKIHHEAVALEIGDAHGGGPLGVIGLDGDEHGVEGLRHLLELMNMERAHRHHVIAAGAREAQPLGADGLDVLGPLIHQRDVLARLREQPAHHAPDRAGPDDSDPHGVSFRRARLGYHGRAHREGAAMLSAVEFIQLGLTRLHASLDKSLVDLTPEQLHAVPAGHPKANTIAWGLWHYARTEDNVVRYLLQDRRPTVWGEGGYAERLGLPPVAQGTGMSVAEAQALRIKDLALFKAYVAKVWASTDEFLARPDRDAVLGKPIMVKPLGEMPGIVALGTVCLTHGMTHFGEIELARTLVGAATTAAGV
jgi:hypothetical protein